jgi:hypothetical protein
MWWDWVEEMKNSFIVIIFGFGFIFLLILCFKYPIILLILIIIVSIIISIIIVTYKIIASYKGEKAAKELMNIVNEILTKDGYRPQINEKEKIIEATNNDCDIVLLFEKAAPSRILYGYYIRKFEPKERKKMLFMADVVNAHDDAWSRSYWAWVSGEQFFFQGYIGWGIEAITNDNNLFSELISALSKPDSWYMTCVREIQ